MSSKLKVDCVTDTTTVIRHENGEPLLRVNRVLSDKANIDRAARDAEMQALAAFEGHPGVRFVEKSAGNVISVVFTSNETAQKFYDFMGGQ